MLKELSCSYRTIKDLARVMNRLKALYRSWALPVSAGESTQGDSVPNG
jgi:hypothetical protein